MLVDGRKCKEDGPQYQTHSETARSDALLLGEGDLPQRPKFGAALRGYCKKGSYGGEDTPSKRI